MNLHRTSPTTRWYFYHQGKRITTPCTDRRTAEAWKIQHLAALAERRIIGPANATMDDLFDLVERDYEDNGKCSIQALRSRLRRLRKFFGGMRASEVCERSVGSYRRSRDAAPATVNRELEVLRRAFSLGKRNKLIASPAHVEIPAVDNVRTQRITHEQYRRLVDAMSAPEKYAAVLAYHTGWRLGRVLGMRWEQVDWDAGVIHPPQRQSKNKRVGIAPIYGDMASALTACLELWPQSESVFRIRSVRAAWQKACAATGLGVLVYRKYTGLRFHDLRACAASNLIDAGVPQVEAMKILGHQTDAMFRRYQIDSPKRVRGIGEQMEKFLGGSDEQADDKLAG